MKHDAYTERLSALLDGELDEKARAETLEHLSACEECRRYFAELSALHDALCAPDDAEVPDGFADGVLTRLHEENAPRGGKRRRVWGGVAALAACAAALAVVSAPLFFHGGSAAPKSAKAETAAPQSAEANTAAPKSAEAETAAQGADLIASDGGEEEFAPAAAYGADSAREDADKYGALDLPADAGATPAPASETTAEQPMEAADAEPSADAAVETERRKRGGGTPTLTLSGDGAAEWLAEHGEPLGGGRWRVAVEEVNAMPDTLELLAEEGLQEPEDGTLIITFAAEENAQ